MHPKKFAIPLLGFAILASGCQKKNEPQTIPDSVRQEAIAAASESCQQYIERLKTQFGQDPGAFYDFLSVPEDPANPQGQQIKIFYYGHKGDANHIPIAFFNGGPTANSHSDAVVLTSMQKSDKKWATIPFIFIDQRGTGCSDPYPQGSSVETIKRLTHYGSRGIVSDAEQIRQHLGLSKWKIFGQSYGAFVVHRYATIAPDSLVAAYAHAGIITSDGFQRMVGRLRAQTRVLETFFADYSSDRDLLKSLTRALGSDVCFKKDGFAYSICGQDAISPLISHYLGFSKYWLQMHRDLNLFFHDGALDRDRLQAFVEQNNFQKEEPGRSTDLASVVIDDADRNVASLDFNNCNLIYQQLRAEHVPEEDLELTECSVALQKGPRPSNSQAEWIRKNVPQDLLTISDFKASLVSHPALKFYLYSGSKDTYVPMDDYVEELGAVAPAEGPKLVIYTNFPGTGHDGFSEEPKVWADLLAN